MKAPWNYLRGRRDGARPCARNARPRFLPTLEILEERQLPSTVVGPQPASTSWRNLTFKINDQVTTASTAIGTTSAQDMEDAQLIGLDQTFASYPYRGNGYTVAVIDTGIDYNNPALGGGWGKRVIAGWNFVANNSNPMDDNGHGTFVAGVMGSSNPTYEGIAPDVDFVALKVLDASGTGTYGNVDLALQWVAAHQAQYNIVAVNLSLGSGNYASEPMTYLDADFQALVKQDVFIAVAAGNSYYTYGSVQGLAYPAVCPSVVSVGAVWDGNYGEVTWMNGAVDYTTAPNLITSFTQRDPNLDILAPGAMLTSTVLDDQFASMAGTSMSTPVVAASAVLIHQALDSLGKHSLTDQQDILSIMQKTGTAVTDGTPSHDNVTNTGLTFKSLNLFAALNSLQAAAPGSPSAPAGPSQPPVLGAVPNQTMQSGQSLIVSLPATDPAGYTIQLSAQASSPASQEYLLRQQLGLMYAGSYYYNSYGAKEKWLLGNNAQWYCITPDGKLHHFVGTIAKTLLPANLVASLSVADYDNPSLLYNAAAPTNPPVTLGITGNQLTITAPASYTGSFQITVTASDGHASATGTFQVTVASAPPPAPVTTPTPSPSPTPSPGNVTFNSSQGSGTVTLSGAGQGTIFTAGLGGSSLQAVQLQKSLGLCYLGGYFQNLQQQNEKWLGGSNGQIYFLLPDGELRRYVTDMATSMGSAQDLVATLDTSFYANPQLLWNPVQPTFQITGNQLTVQFPQGYLGTFVIQVTAKTGSTTTVQTYDVTVASQA